MFVIWNDEKHSLGIPDIDSQHKELFLIANQIADVDNSGLRQQRLIDIVKRLYAYTKYHFSTEEAVFSHYGYPDTAEHKAIHLAYGEKVKAYLDEIRADPHYDTAGLLDFLVNWIVHHIQEQDRAYMEFFNKAGIKIETHFSPSESPAGSRNPAEANTVRQDALAMWNDRQLSLELKDIDNQHKELVYILQQANDLSRTSENRQRMYLRAIIQKLFYYTQYHFSWEEAHMSQHNYPQLAQHRKLHAQFIKHILDFSDAYRAKHAALSIEITGFLRDWILTHILVEDRKFKEYLQVPEKR